MLIFQLDQKQKETLEPTRIEIPKQFSDFIRKLKNEGKIVDKPTYMPEDSVKWEIFLYGLCGKKDDKYLSVLHEIIKGSESVFDGSDKFIAGFFYGLKLKSMANDFRKADGSLDLEGLKEHFGGEGGVFRTEGVSPNSSDVAAEGAVLAIKLAYEEDLSEQSVIRVKKTKSKTVGPNVSVGKITTLKTVSFANVEVPVLHSLSFERPPAIFVSTLFPGANTFQKIINDAVISLGGIPDQDNGVFHNFPPAFVSGSALVKYKSILQRFNDWFSDSFTDAEGRTWKVGDYIKAKELRNPNEFEDFKKALLEGRFRDAISYMKEGGPAWNALGTSSIQSENIASVLDKRALADLLNHSISFGTAVTYRLDEKGSTALQVYLKYDNTILVTNEKIESGTGGLRFLANINPIDMKLVAGVGGQFSSSGEPEWYLEGGVGQRIPIAGYLSGVLRTSFNSVFGTTHTLIYGADVEAGLGADTPRFTAEVVLSKSFAPGMEEKSFMENIGGKLGVGYKITTFMKIDWEAGTYRFGKNEFGVVPWYTNLKLSFTL